MQDAAKTYQKFAEYYDLYVGSFNYDLNCYLSFCEKKDNILEVGCGTGRILDAFLKKDFAIFGVDIAAEMLQKAEEKLLPHMVSGKLKLANHDFSKSTMKGDFSKVLVSFFTFNYIIDHPLEFLTNLYKSMSPGAMLLMDMFVPSANTIEKLDQWHESKISVEGREITILDNRYTESSIEYRTQVYIENGHEVRIATRRRYFSPAELLELLKKSGFHNIEFSLAYDISKFSPSIDQSNIDRHFLVKAKK